MALTTNGLTNGGVTAHYNFSYDDSFAGPGGAEPARTNAVIAQCENDYNLMSGWFGGGVNVTGMTVQVTATNGVGASWGARPPLPPLSCRTPKAPPSGSILPICDIC
jgi:hypothetical protein